MGPHREHLYAIYAATRRGGPWKTTNNGITWAAISDSVGAAAVGAVAVAPWNPGIVWMGTGDQANGRSSYSGRGVFKSTDGGRTREKTHGDGIGVAGSKTPYSFNQIRTNRSDPTHVIVNSDSMYKSKDGAAARGRPRTRPWRFRRPTAAAGRLSDRAVRWPAST